MVHISTNLYRRSYMSAHVLLNLLNELGKRQNVMMALYKSTNVRFFISYDNEITLKSFLWHENLNILPLYKHG